MAYGEVPPPQKAHELDLRLYRIPPRAAATDAAAIVTVPFDCSKGHRPPEALETELRNVFNLELENGVTYPQRGPMSAIEFQKYFLSYDVVIGVLVNEDEAKTLLTNAGITKISDVDAKGVSLSSAFVSAENIVQGRTWTKSYAFSYYIKPNYPGRSSHLCNAGFVVPPYQRGRGLGSVAGVTFLHYGPLCGYRGSVFNLVYANNQASVRIWERLGFTPVGKIPGAGLLRKLQEDGTIHPTEQEYIDAWVIHGDFEKLSERGMAPAPAPAPAE